MVLYHAEKGRKRSKKEMDTENKLKLSNSKEKNQLLIKQLPVS